jgi:hypothetical protein
MVFERFTERARQVVVLAQEEARGLRHNYIGSEHILLGLLREQEGLAARVLESLDITVERVRGQVVRIVGSGEEVASGQIPFTPRAKKVFELALREALSLGCDYIGTEHILLGLVRENEGVAARILLDFDADSEKIRNEVRRMLSGPRRQARIEVLRSGAVAHPLRPPFDWEHAGALWRPDRVLRAAARELERAASRVLEEQFGVQVSPVRQRHARRASPVVVSHGRPTASFTPFPSSPPPARGFSWEQATFLWRPEGLELRVPLRLEPDAIAALAADPVWTTAPLAKLRREIWTGWLALASATLLDDVDPTELRRTLDDALKRALETTSTQPRRIQDFLHRLRN